MKKIITVTLCIVLVLLFAGCGKNGDTSKVEIDYGASSIYSKEEIDSAIEIIKKQFALFEGCELHRDIRYLHLRQERHVGWTAKESLPCRC